MNFFILFDDRVCCEITMKSMYPESYEHPPLCICVNGALVNSDEFHEAVLLPNWFPKINAEFGDWNRFES